MKIKDITPALTTVEFGNLPYNRLFRWGSRVYLKVDDGTYNSVSLDDARLGVLPGHVTIQPLDGQLQIWAPSVQ